jgi:hypothetical protein
MPRRYMNVDAARLGVVNNVALATTSTSVASAAFGASTYQVRIAATAPAFYRVGVGTPTAAATDALLPLNWVEYVTVSPSEKIAFFSPTIQTISVVEIAQ